MRDKEQQAKSMHIKAVLSGETDVCITTRDEKYYEVSRLPS
jgi:hypothetical protein